MKKIIFLLLTVLIVSCSSSDDPNPVPSCWDSPSFVGTWQGTDGTDQDVHFLIDLVLNNDGTGQFCQTDADGEDCQNINWESNFKVFSITLEGQTDTITFFYEFLNCDQVILTHTDTTGEPVTFTRQ